MIGSARQATSFVKPATTRKTSRKCVSTVILSTVLQTAAVVFRICALIAKMATI